MYLPLTNINLYIKKCPFAKMILFFPHLHLHVKKKKIPITTLYMLGEKYALCKRPEKKTVYRFALNKIGSGLILYLDNVSLKCNYFIHFLFSIIFS